MHGAYYRQAIQLLERNGATLRGIINWNIKIIIGCVTIDDDNV